MDEHAASTARINELFLKLERIAGEENPDAFDADPVSPQSVAVAGDILHRISTASVCHTLNRSAAANAELYPSRDGGILIIVPLNAKDFEFMIDPDGEIDLGITTTTDPIGMRTVVDRGTINASQVISELKVNS